MSKKTGIVKDMQYVRHGPEYGHPESPQRLISIYEMLDNPDMSWKFAWIDARYATREELERVHRPSYIDYIAATAGKTMMLDPDTVATAETYDAARLAAGGFINAVDSVVSGETDNAFALVRPPGHHAQAAEAAGFCIFNNIAIGVRHALARHRMKRVLIVDWDLHHGNGTQEAFYEDRQVLYFSTHQSPAYPGTGGLMEMGEGEGFGYTLNVPLSPGAGDALYVRLFHDILSPIALAFRPEIILVSAGFDTYVGDPLGAMEVTPEGFACMTRILLDLADECCGGRLAATLEGGYNIQGLTKSVRAVLLELLGETRVTEETLIGMVAGTDEKASRVIRRVREQFDPYWPVLRNER
ncbi:MAG: histone deacetylase [Proteobacteria bacterium]|nr:histone deacetylase [Pseudomonadota bacterium]MBU2234211.1 histone deacetylase [Pseudomonadota bacterium]MBU4121350.1 histone deacetylase [Pseudomonadota bacterium]